MSPMRSARAWASLPLAPPPSIPPSIPGDRMSCWASLNWRSSWLTSWVVVPLPRAMREPPATPSMSAGVAALVAGHGADDRLDLGHLAVVDAGLLA